MDLVAMSPFQMLEQFQNLLDSPKGSPKQLLKQTQDLILNALEGMFPAEYDFSELARLYENEKLTSSPEALTYHLVRYFIQLLSENFISVHSYQSLELQTQKMEATIRSHIKLEQEVKMYLEHLEVKINRYEHYIQNYIHQKEASAQHRPNHQETVLLKERISLIRTNEKLMNKLREKEEELKKMNRINSSHLGIVENFIQKDKLAISKSEHNIKHIRLHSETLSSRAMIGKEPLPRQQSVGEAERQNLVVEADGSRQGNFNKK